MQFNIKRLPIAVTNWEEMFNKPLTERDGYSFDENGFSYTQVAGMILGTPWDALTYREFLCNLTFDRKDVHVLTSGGKDKQISNNQLQSIQRIMNFHRESNGLSVNRLIAFMEGESLFPLKEDKDYYIHLRKACTDLFKTFEAQNKTLLHNDFGRVLTDIVKWSWNYIEKWITETDYKKQPVRVVWYGRATTSETYFLYFLIILGIDVLIFHPEGENIFAHLQGVEISICSYPNILEFEPLPASKSMREATVAKKASAELEQILGGEGIHIFKPWQLREHLPIAVTLHTTYDEVRLISREKAFVRPGFEVNDKKVHIPVLFSKICGISKERMEYAQNYRELLNTDMVVSRTTFPFSAEVKGNHRFHYEQSLVSGELDPQRIVSANWWRYKLLPNGLQVGLASTISRYVKSAKLKPIPGEDVRHFLFTQAMEIPDDIMQIMQRFDYSQTVPKLVLFNNGNSGEISRADAARILLFNEFGFDIILLNPTGQNDIELYIDSGQFDSHWLEEISFEEDHQLIMMKQGHIIQQKKKKIKSLFKRLLDK